MHVHSTAKARDMHGYCPHDTKDHRRRSPTCRASALKPTSGDITSTCLERCSLPLCRPRLDPLPAQQANPEPSF